MGLDNIPHRYACERLGTAVKVSFHNKEGNEVLDEATGLPMKQINCEKTIEEKVCPYTLAFEKSGLTDGSVVGMFGTPCWYRGKYGNYLLEALNIDDNENNFYGDSEEGTYKSPDSCEALANLMEEQMNKMGLPVMFQNKDATADIKYAIWWLRWVANECSGSDAWY